MGRFARSWALVKASASVLKQDRELLVFPLISSLAAMVVAASFIVPLVAAGEGLERFEQDDAGRVFAFVWLFLFYLAQYFVIFFFNTALVGAAMIRLDGGDPTVADGFRIASSKIGKILGYAAIAATVGMILRAIEERAGIVGRWVAGLIGVAWTVATFLTVPVLVAQDVGPVDAVRESARLLKKTWGENLIGGGGLGLAFGLVQFVVIALGVGLMMLVIPTKSGVAIVAAGGLLVAVVLVLALIHAALSGIYSAALYRYAIGHQGTHGFEPALLEAAFRPKK